MHPRCRRLYFAKILSEDRLSRCTACLYRRNANVFERQLISTFWECYIPSRSSVQAGSPCAWLQQSICLPDPPPALRSSLIALAMTRLGSLHGDNAYLRGGRVIYGHALRELQTALCHERSMYQDEIMATCNVLALYEVGISSMKVVRNSHQKYTALRVDTIINHRI